MTKLLTWSRLDANTCMITVILRGDNGLSIGMANRLYTSHYTDHYFKILTHILRGTM